MNSFVNFMVSSNGRIARIVTGIALIVLGLVVLSGTPGIIVAVIGLVPLLASLLDFRIFAPFLVVPSVARKFAQAYNLSVVCVKTLGLPIPVSFILRQT